MSMLPECRVGHREWPLLKQLPADPRGWDNLMKGSRQGFVILLLSLSWWAARATKKKVLSSVLDDMLFVVRELAKNVSANDTSVSHKRARGSISALPTSKR